MRQAPQVVMRCELSTHPNKTGQGGRRLREKLGRGVWMTAWAMSHPHTETKSHAYRRLRLSRTHTHTPACARPRQSRLSRLISRACAGMPKKEGGVVAWWRCTGARITLFRGTSPPMQRSAPIIPPTHRSTTSSTHKTHDEKHTPTRVHAHEEQHTWHTCTRGAAHTNTSPLSARVKSKESYGLMHTCDNTCDERAR